MRKNYLFARNCKRSMGIVSPGAPRRHTRPMRIVKIFSGVLLATTGIAAPVGIMAETLKVEDERYEVSVREDEMQTSAQSTFSASLLQASIYMPDSTTADAIINNNGSVVLSDIENPESGWDKFTGLVVGKNTAGSLFIDGRHINTLTGSIGNNASGSVTLINGASWKLDGGNLVLGTNDGEGNLWVLSGSSISGIGGLRIGEYAAKATGSVTIDGKDSLIDTGWVVVGDQGKGVLILTDGGRLSTTRHMNIGYVGVTVDTVRKGNGYVQVSGVGSELNVKEGLYLGGFEQTPNDATGVLTVSDGGTVKVGTLIWLAVGKGSTGILNIGGGMGEEAQLAGYVDTPRIHLGDNLAHENTAILNLNHLTDELTLKANITGRGEVLHEGTGATLLTGNNTWSGNAILNNGTLRAGSSGAFSPKADFTVGPNATLDLNGYNQTINSLILKGVLNYGHTSTCKHDLSLSKNALTVNGDYHSDEGALVLNTGKDLDNVESQVNRLHIKGNSSGTTWVYLNELGGLGNDNLNGTQVVQVDGNSDGVFLAGGRLVAGAHEYSVSRGVASEILEASTVSDANHWYLTNETFIPGTLPDEESPDPGHGITPENGIVYRPEAGAYLANRVAGNTLFNTRLHDRLGESQYIDPLTGKESVTSLWMRHIGGHTRFRDSTGQMKTQTNRYVIQLGGDLAQWSTGLTDRLHLGAMVGYANSQSNTRSAITRYEADGSVSGYSAGLYATWYANEADKSGTYVDSWMLYNWFGNSVKGEQLATEYYRSHGITASVETGIAFKTGESERVSYWLQPQMQLTWMGVTADNHRERNGTQVKDSGKSNLQSRLGVKAYLRGHSQRDDGKDRLFQPFVEANWLHNTENVAITMNNTATKMSGAKNTVELRTGVEAKINHRLHVWGNVGQQIGSQGYSDTQAVLGIKMLF